MANKNGHPLAHLTFRLGTLVKSKDKTDDRPCFTRGFYHAHNRSREFRPILYSASIIAYVKLMHTFEMLPFRRYSVDDYYESEKIWHPEPWLLSGSRLTGTVLGCGQRTAAIQKKPTAAPSGDHPRKAFRWGRPSRRGGSAGRLVHRCCPLLEHRRGRRSSSCSNCDVWNREANHSYKNVYSRFLKLEKTAVYC